MFQTHLLMLMSHQYRMKTKRSREGRSLVSGVLVPCLLLELTSIVHFHHSSHLDVTYTVLTILDPTGTMSIHRPLKLAIIGAGPSGFYTASRILSLLPANSEKGNKVEVHMYDRLPTPYGLVRYGVAPDHPEVKVSRGLRSIRRCTMLE